MTRLITRINDPVLMRVRSNVAKDNAISQGARQADKQKQSSKKQITMQGKIKITDKSMLKKLPAAAEQAGVKLQEPFPAGGAIHQPLTFRDPAHLVDLGLIWATISDKDIADYDKRMADKAAKKAAA